MHIFLSGRHHHKKSKKTKILHLFGSISDVFILQKCIRQKIFWAKKFFRAQSMAEFSIRNSEF